ncbi:YdeI/OmpD-associated family protein [Pontibacter vulgaris]|uniref:YdeI/OmpD-associated family protein n=1 Tax=Pontibacter vulgaris TaxID=2905679 RepID=UPI001FA7C7D3|nr:YdeI/OmpD-associated family protein [Pontibacter vulgaris]
MPEIGKKLQLKPDYTLLLINAPQEVAQQFLDEGYTFTAASVAPATGAFDAVLLFVKTKTELDGLAPQVVAVLKPEGMLWVAYPKKSSGIKSDLTRNEGWKTITELDYQAVRQVAIDDTWSALRFKHASERKAPSMFGVDKPGIDRVARTVTVPDDLKEALDSMGFLEVFEKLSFTQRKEAVLGVTEAKRPETRANRIGKIVEQMLGLAQKYKL